MSDVLERPPVVDEARLRGRNNLNQTPLGPSGKWTLEKVLALTPEEAVALWHAAPSPTLQEMNGHYMGLGANGDNPERQAGFAKSMLNESSRLGYWLGKAFRPVTATEGEGYNRWRYPGGKIVHNQCMKTRVGPSIIDGNPCYQIDYHAVNPNSTLFDEIRRLDDGVYLGTATTELKGGGRPTKLNSAFLLLGPYDRWVGGPYEADLRPGA
jgi:hypothetical protein